jgi:hypothetical protein
MKDHEFIFNLECKSREPDIQGPRTCRLLEKMSAPDRDDYWLAVVDPPFIGQHFGLGAEDVSQVIVATRLKNYSLVHPSPGAISVYIARIADANVVRTKTIRSPDQIQLILWCELRLPVAPNPPV